MAILTSVRIRGLSGGALPTTACVSCGTRAEVLAIRVPRTFPVGLLFGFIFALPLLLALVICIVWGSRDLFDIMAGTGGRHPTELRILRALPVVLAAVWSIAAVIALEALCRRLGLRLSLCRPCAAGQRRRRVLVASVLALTLIALAALLYLLPGPALDERKWGLLFAPWVILAALLFNETRAGGVRIRALSDDVYRVLGAPAFAEVVKAECPAILTAEAAARIWPPRLELVAWAAPALLAGISILGPRLERLPLECPYGTYPLLHRSGTARIVGCRAPDGSAHGHSRGEAGAWNSNPRSPGFSGTWWFGRPHGEFAFLDAKGRVRAQGHYVFGQPRGRWQVFDEWGTVLEELEVLTRPVRVVVHRAHPHLKCPPSEIESTGLPAWGTRACPRYDQPAPFVRVENARVVETGMR